jgi:hypothetical protein
MKYLYFVVSRFDWSIPPRIIANIFCESNGLLKVEDSWAGTASLRGRLTNEGVMIEPDPRGSKVSLPARQLRDAPAPSIQRIRQALAARPLSGCPAHGR